MPSIFFTMNLPNRKATSIAKTIIDNPFILKKINEQLKEKIVVTMNILELIPSLKIFPLPSLRA